MVDGAACCTDGTGGLGSIDMPTRIHDPHPDSCDVLTQCLCGDSTGTGTARPHLSSRPAGAHGRAVTGGNTSSPDHAAGAAFGSLLSVPRRTEPPKTAPHSGAAERPNSLHGRSTATAAKISSAA